MGVRVKKVYPKLGENGADVEKYQKLLAKSGSKIKANGWFSVGMMSAIKCFQKKQGLPVTGKLDTKTATALEALATAKKKPAARKTK